MKFEKEQIEQRMKQSIRFILRYKKKWGIAGLMLALGGGLVAAAYYYSPKELQQEAAAAPLMAENIDWEQETTAPIVESTESVEQEWKPNPGELNLAHYFPEGADQSDITKSLAGEAFKILMTHDEEWISSIYDFSDVTPAQMAARLGRSESTVKGQFNPKDNRHDRSNPDTWTINSFKNIRMTAEDGDGNSITPRSNVLEIMSMANFYTYHKGVEDYDLFLSYSKELWELSHSYSVSMSKVYYCSGCMSEDAERKEMEALEAEAKAEALGLTLESEAEDSAEASADQSQDNMEVTAAASTVIVAGKTAAEREAAAAREKAETTASETQESVPESTTRVITSQRSLKETTSAAETLAAAPENTVAGDAAEGGAAESTAADTGLAAESSVIIAADSASDSASEPASAAEAMAAGEHGAADTVFLAAESSESSSDQPSDGLSEHAGATPSDAQKAVETKASESKESESLTDCPGHVDLIIHMKIIGLDEKNNLFGLDPKGSDTAGFEENGWSGWDEYAKACARILSNQDWFEKYGLTVSSISSRNPLTNAEIEAYMAQLPPDLSETRKDIIRFALNSVGKVPYYWGGKPSAPSYASNSFGVLTTPDYKGRVYKGLDCSGWINWVYWSATGKRLPYESTSGLAVTGTKIQRNELQPGDIIVRTGADAHVIMFLGWTADGRIQCIHESSAAVNNVTIATRDANWPYYRKLVD